eukprot:Hpha_TRINITY_DN16122_c1_g1::TRINITY_DN16122_c1_g1_i3::g.7278::m.7278
MALVQSSRGLPPAPVWLSGDIKLHPVAKSAPGAVRNTESRTTVGERRAPDRPGTVERPRQHWTPSPHSRSEFASSRVTREERSVASALACGALRRLNERGHLLRVFYAWRLFCERAREPCPTCPTPPLPRESAEPEPSPPPPRGLDTLRSPPPLPPSPPSPPTYAGRRTATPTAPPRRTRRCSSRIEALARPRAARRRTATPKESPPRRVAGTKMRTRQATPLEEQTCDTTPQQKPAEPRSPRGDCTRCSPTARASPSLAMQPCPPWAIPGLRAWTASGSPASPLPSPRRASPLLPAPPPSPPVLVHQCVSGCQSDSKWCASHLFHPRPRSFPLSFPVHQPHTLTPRDHPRPRHRSTLATCLMQAPRLPSPRSRVSVDTCQVPRPQYR